MGKGQGSRVSVWVGPWVLEPSVQRDLGLIWTYERQVGRRPGGLQVQRGPRGGFVPIRARSAAEVADEALRCEDFVRWCAEVDGALDGPWGRHDLLMVRDVVPDVLWDLGVDDMPLLYTAHHARLAVCPKGSRAHAHGLTRRTLKRLAEALDRPAAVLENTQGRKSLLVVLDLLDTDADAGRSYPVVVPVQPGEWVRERGEQANFVLTAFGNEAPGKMLADAVRERRVLYVDQGRLSKVAHACRARVPEQMARMSGVVRRPAWIGECQQREI